MIDLHFTVGNAQHRAADSSVVAPLDIDYFFRLGIIAPGQKVHVHYKQGVFTGLDALFNANAFDCDIDAPWGEAFIDATGVGAYPYNGVVDHERRFSGSWGAKGGWFFCSGNFRIGKGIRIENFTNGDNRAAIFLCGPAYAVLKGGKHVDLTGPTNVIIDDGVTIRRCDNAVRSSDAINPRSWILVKGGALIEECGIGDGQSHDFYIGRIAVFALIGNTVRNSKVGNAVKLRSRVSIIAGNNLRDTPNVLKASSSICDISGGQAFVFGNDMGQGLNDSNPSKENYFYTERDGDGPHRCIWLGNTDHADEAYRGVVLRVSNPRRDPTVLWTAAPQLKDAAGNLIWNHVDVAIDGNDTQHAPGKLSFGNTAGGVWTIPANNGINLLTPLPGGNRLVDKTSAAAQTPFAFVDKAHLRRYRIGARIADLAPADYTPALMNELAAIDAEEQAAWVPPELASAPPPPQPYDEDTDPVLIAENQRLTSALAVANATIVTRDATIAAKDQQIMDATAAAQAEKTRADGTAQAFTTYKNKMVADAQQFAQDAAAG